MLRPLLRVSALLLLGGFLAACAWMPGAKERRKAELERKLEEAKRAPLAVGRVSLVNEGERFALIEANLAQSPPPGTILRIYQGSAVSAELRATGVRRRPFLVADLVNGTPEKGDLVVQPGSGEAATPPRAEAAAATTEAAPAPKPAPFWKRWLRMK